MVKQMVIRHGYFQFAATIVPALFRLDSKDPELSAIKINALADCPGRRPVCFTFD